MQNVRKGFWGKLNLIWTRRFLPYEMLLYQLLHTDIYPAAVTYAGLTYLKKMVASARFPLLSRNSGLQNFFAMFRR